MAGLSSEEWGAHFGAVAEEYDAARPAYAEPMLDWLGARAGLRVLDVGCGTGVLGRQLMARGCDVLGVEVDERMAAVARRHGLAVEVGHFEEWDARGRRFDLVVSGSAWHWIDPICGAECAAEALEPGGRFAAMWLEFRHHHEPLTAMLACYQRHAPTMAPFVLGFDSLPTPASDPAGAAIAAGPFDGAAAGMRTCCYEPRRYTPRQWTDLLRTLSDHRALPEVTLRALIGDLEQALGALGPTFPVVIGTAALVATRR